MAEQERFVVRETVRSRALDVADNVILHLVDKAKAGDAEGVPIRCGGYIILPPALEKVPLSQVCPDCRAGVLTL